MNPPFPAGGADGACAGLAGRRVAVVGGAGFVGHHLALGLTAEGAAVEVVDGLRGGQLLETLLAPDDAGNRSFHLGALAGRIEALRALSIPMACLDAREVGPLREHFAGSRPEIVIHAAGADGEEPHRGFEHGVRSLAAVLEATRGLGSRTVLLSSDSIYGRAEEPADETCAPAPQCLEGARHAAAEAWLAGVCRHDGRPFAVVRSGPLYGPRAAGRGRVAELLEAALAGDPLRLAGDGRARRDHTHVDDLVSGVRALLRDPARAVGTWNLAYGHARSERELANRIAEYFPGCGVERSAPTDPEPRHLALDIEKARRELDFSPRRPLESGIPDAVRELIDACGGRSLPRQEPKRRAPWSGGRPILGPGLR